MRNVKFLVRSFVIVAAIFAAMTLLWWGGALPTAWSPPIAGKIEGKTSQERIEKFVKIFNTDTAVKDYATLVFVGYTPSREWKFGLLISQNSREVATADGLDPRFAGATKKFFVTTATEVFPTDENISLRVSFADWVTELYTTEASRIRREPEDGNRFVQERSATEDRSSSTGKQEAPAK